MERGLILLVAALMVYVAPGVQGTLSFANNTEVNITLAGCNVTKVCVETPLNCDPTGHSSCLFVSVVGSNSVAPTDLSFELRGDSTGYIAVGLAAEPSEVTTMVFICAQNRSNNGTFLFETMQRNNAGGLLTPHEMSVTKIQGTVNGSVIQCKFTVPNMKPTTYSILLGTGSFDGKSFGLFNISVNSSALNLTNPVRNTTTTTTNSPVTMDNHTMTSETTRVTHPGPSAASDHHSSAATDPHSSVATDHHSSAATDPHSSVATDHHSSAASDHHSSAATDPHSSVATDHHSNATTHPGSSGAVHPLDVLLLLSVLTLSVMLGA